MIGARGILVTFVITSLLAIILMGYRDRMEFHSICKSASTHKIDKCAKNGGFIR